MILLSLMPDPKLFSNEMLFSLLFSLLSEAIENERSLFNESFLCLQFFRKNSFIFFFEGEFSQ